MGGVVASQEYELQLQLALLRTVAAVLRSEPNANLEPIHREILAVDSSINALPSQERPILTLASRLGWSPIETDFVWVTVALATEPRMLVHARALDTSASQGMSISLYSRIAYLDAAASQALGRAMQVDRPLPRSGLVVSVPGIWLPTSAPWSPVPQLLDYLLEEEQTERFPVGMTWTVPPFSIVLDDAQRDALATIHSTLQCAGMLLVLHGAEGSGRRSAIAQASERPILTLDISRLDGSQTALDHGLTTLFREASLRNAIAVIVAPEELSGDAQDVRLRQLGQRIDESGTPVVVITKAHGIDVRSMRPTIRVAWNTPSVEARLTLWRELAGDFDSIDHSELAQRYRIGAGAVVKAVASARSITAKGLVDALTTAEIIAGVRHNTAERMAGLAERIQVKQSWSDCILPEDVQTQINALVGRAKQAHLVFQQWGYHSKMPRGTGLAAMFSGPPGTGKTMVAGLIANQLDRELYQVDLSKVVSKWIGETEKQLGTLFDAAEDGHALLLFDEADSMFGKRSSEMRSASDRYANLEVNFLLQRLENFHGIVILTTNLDASIDNAFKRRLAAHVVFQHPEENERVELWRRMVASDGAPLARDIDERALARQFPKMSGANIRNAALAAAFLAAGRSHSINHATLVAAARSEYLSMGHVLATNTL